MYNTVLFDLDGSLTDPGLGISIGVLYGYGRREELELAGATYIAETVNDILKFI